MPDVLIIPSIVGIFIIFDIVTGITQAVSNKTLNSTKLRQGLFHKMSFIFAVCLAYLIDYGVGYVDLGFNFPIALPTCVYVILIEIVSIVENLVKLNPGLKNSKLIRQFMINDSDLDADIVVEETPNVEDSINQ